MAHGYYCLGCGKKLSQQTVLFDMQFLLTGDLKRKFNILRFRMTQQELEMLLESGAPTEDEFRTCGLTWEQIMACISNENNLNDPQVASVTREEAEGYIDQGMAMAVAMDDDSFWDDDEEDLEEEEEAWVEPYVTPAGIQAMENKDRAITDKCFTRIALRADLEAVRKAFGEEDIVCFQIKGVYEMDDRGEPVLTGCCVKYADGGLLRLENRICSRCGEPVFSHAGTARHQTVAFVGNVGSGASYDVILALAHYAENYMQLGFGSDIWQGSETIDSVATVELVGCREILENDLREFGKGICPPKTRARYEPSLYSATLFIRNKAQKQGHLLTLWECRREYRNWAGAVDAHALRESFPAALECDAMITCVSMRHLRNFARNLKAIFREMTELQQLRMEEQGNKSDVPVMLLLMEEKPLNDLGMQNVPDPQERMYLLREETQQIANDPEYSAARREFLKTGGAGKGYYAMMRCTAYGYRAPCSYEIRRDTQVKLPAPRNMDRLMRWILSVTGCIPTETTFARNPQAIPYKLNGFCLSRPQLRHENPLKGSEVEEAMARCALFENPGRFDRKFVSWHDDKIRLSIGKMKAGARPDTNDRE